MSFDIKSVAVGFVGGFLASKVIPSLFTILVVLLLAGGYTAFTKLKDKQ